MALPEQPTDFCGLCREALHPVSREFGLLWLCPPCEAAYATIPVLRRLIGPHVARDLCSPEDSGPVDSLACPFCGAKPVQTSCGFDGARIRVPFCRLCHAARLERGVLEAILVPLRTPAEDALRRADAQVRVALLGLLQQLERS